MSGHISNQRRSVYGRVTLWACLLVTNASAQTTAFTLQWPINNDSILWTMLNAIKEQQTQSNN